MKDWAPFLGMPLWVWLFVLPTLFAGLCLYKGDKLEKPLRPIWTILDKLYKAGGALAALALVVILGIMVAQMIARWTGVTFSGSTKYAGYAMACASFFALAYALTHGAHIRVSLVLGINNFTKVWLDRAALLISAITATYFARYALKTANDKWNWAERTDGLDTVPEWLVTLFTFFSRSPSEWGTLWADTGSSWVPTPIWMVQVPMTLGTVLLAVALWDMLYRTLVLGRNPIVSEAVE